MKKNIQACHHSERILWNYPILDTIFLVQCQEVRQIEKELNPEGIYGEGRTGTRTDHST